MKHNHKEAGVTKIQPRAGEVQFPAYMPVTTFSGDFPADKFIQPFLRRWAEISMVSLHHARTMTEKTMLPTKALFIDSGGFACLLNCFEITERSDETGCIVKVDEEGGRDETISPERVLDVQQRLADFGATLDFPIPPGLTDEGERKRRLRMTLANAQWALDRHQGGMVLFGSVQGYDVDSYLACASAMVEMGFEHLAIGGLVPRQRDTGLIEEVCSKVAGMLRSGGLLHAFGLGKPEQVGRLMRIGVTSVDSSSYVQTAAAAGKRWDGTP